MFTLHAVGGLCNRMRAILSWRQVHGSLRVVWSPNEYVDGGRWADVFEPLDGVEFVDAGVFDVESCGIEPTADPSWTAGYRAVMPRDYLRARVRALVESMGGDFAAMHVRRTDSTPLSREHGTFVKDCEFLDWAARLDPAKPLFLATDNRETQEDYARLLGARVVTADPVRASREEQSYADHRRHTSLAHAVVDLFVCAHSSQFKGSGGMSSFSDTIEILRAHRAAGWPI